MNKKTFVALGLALSLVASSAVPALAASENITQLVFTTPAKTVPVGTPSGRVVVQTRNAANVQEFLSEDIQLDLSSSSATGQFASGSETDCLANWGVARLSVIANTANRSFCYRDTAAGLHTLTVSALGKPWTAAVQQVTIETGITPTTTATTTAATSTATSTDPTPDPDPSNATTTPNITPEIRSNSGHVSSGSHRRVVINRRPASPQVAGAFIDLSSVSPRDLLELRLRLIELLIQLNKLQQG